MSAPDDRTLLVPPAAAGGPARIRRATLRFAGGPEDGREVPIPGDAFTIGSAPGCDLRLADGAVSRRHCRVYVDPALGYAVEDLGSTNGTFVNGVRVSRACLPPDAELRLGGTALVFSPQKGARALERSAAESFGRVVGRSDAMRRVFHLAETYAPTEATVMIAGETGTGKEVMAREIHAHSPRRGGPFLVIDCAALSRELVESELFGHVKGAFTGAVADKPGLFETANGGTIFLDEVSSMPLPLQGKLLRVLQEKEIRRVGGNATIPVDVRVIAASNANLEQMAAEGAFRTDLYYRFAVITIEIPPLRDRTEDILPLAAHFLRGEAPAGAAAPTLGKEAQDILMAYKWPGNVRELENALKHAVTFRPEGEIGPADLPEKIVARARESLASAPPAAAAAAAPQSLKSFLKNKEKEYLSRILADSDGDKEKAAKTLQVSLATLYRKISDDAPAAQ